MSDQNNDPQIVDDGLEGLPASDKKETEEILNEIKEEEKSDDDSKADDQKSDKSKEDDSKKDDKSNDDDSGDKDKEDKSKDDDEEEPPRSKGKLMPEWVHKRSLAEKEQIIKDLQAKLDGKSDDKKPSEGEDDKKSDDDAGPDLDKEIKGIAEKHNLDEELVKSLVNLGLKHGGKLPDDIQQRLNNLDEITKEREVALEEQEFDKNFDKFVKPLIKKEYGEKVSSDTIESIKEKLKETAYTEEYKATPYGVIYKGVDDFRGFSRKSEGGGEESRGGFNQNGSDDKSDGIDFDNLTDEEVSKLDGPTFDKYSAHMEAKERKRS